MAKRFVRVVLFAVSCIVFLVAVPAEQAQVVVIGPHHHYRHGYYRHGYYGRRYYRHGYYGRGYRRYHRY